MIRRLLSFLGALGLACVAQAQTEPPAPATAELTQLLHEFLAGASRNDPAAHQRFWADDLTYMRSAVVAFRLVGVTGTGDQAKAEHYLNTGTFVRRNGEWRAVAWQSTKVAEGAGE